MAVKAKFPAQVIVQCPQTYKAWVKREADRREVSEAVIGRELFELAWAAIQAGVSLHELQVQASERSTPLPHVPATVS